MVISRSDLKAREAAHSRANQASIGSIGIDLHLVGTKNQALSEKEDRHHDEDQSLRRQGSRCLPVSYNQTFPSASVATARYQEHCLEGEDLLRHFMSAGRNSLSHKYYRRTGVHPFNRTLSDMELLANDNDPNHIVSTITRNDDGYGLEKIPVIHGLLSPPDDLNHPRRRAHSTPQPSTPVRSRIRRVTQPRAADAFVKAGVESMPQRIAEQGTDPEQRVIDTPSRNRGARSALCREMSLDDDDASPVEAGDGEDDDHEPSPRQHRYPARIRKPSRRLLGDY